MKGDEITVAVTGDKVALLDATADRVTIASALRPGPGGEFIRTGAWPVGRETGAGHLAALMNDCSRGHEEALGELYDLTSTRIYSIVLRVLRSADHAAEVTQEVYVEVWRQSARYTRARGSVLGWMTTMAHRRAVDRFRSVTSGPAHPIAAVASGPQTQ